MNVKNLWGTLMSDKKEELKRIKWVEELACEEMIGKPIKKNGKIIGKVVAIEPCIVVAEVTKEVFKDIYKPILNTIMGVRVDYDHSNRSKSKSN